MTYPISEVLRLFQIEYRLHAGELGEKELLRKNDEFLNFNIGKLLPEIPMSWSRVEGVFRGKNVDGMDFEEISFDFSIWQLTKKVIDSLQNLIQQDLSARLLELYKNNRSIFNKIISEKSEQERYLLLQKHSKGFVSRENEFKTREEQEIAFIRTTCFSLIPLKDLEKAEKKKLDFSDLEREVKKHLDLYVLTQKMECFRVAGFLKLSEREYNRLQQEHREKSEIILSPLESISTPRVQSTHPAAPIEGDSSGQKIKGSKRENLSEKFQSIGVTLTKGEKRAAQIASLHSKLKEPFSFLPVKKILKWTSKLGGIGEAITTISSFVFASNNAKRRNKAANKAYKKLFRGQVAILQNQGILQQQLDQIGKDLGGLAKRQEDIAQGINNLGRSIFLHQTMVGKALASISHEVVLGRMALATILDETGKVCREVRMHLMRDLGYRPYLNRFYSYEGFKSFYLSERLSLKEGLKGLPKLFMNPAENDIPFIISGELNPDDASYFEHFQGLWELFNQSTKEWKNQKQFELLLTPDFNVKHIDASIEATRKKENDSLPYWIGDLFEFNYLGSFFRGPTEFKRLLDYTDSARCFHYFYELIDGLPGKPPVPFEKLTEHRPPPQGLRLLRNAFIRLNIGIAHANLLMGKGVIPFAYQEWKKGNCKEISYLLASNQFLASNFMVYAFRKELEEKKLSLEDYYFPYFNGSDERSMEKLLGEKWNFSWKKKEEKWGVKFGDNEIPFSVPSPSELINGTLKNHPHLTSLLLMRQRILKEMAGYKKGDGSDGGPHSKVYIASLPLVSLFFRALKEAEGKKKQIRAKL